ncbi:hypothetical protein BGZ49_004148 [Haplosporangium sp. Z 27]|nr:hypothetical protein BGZ49_004148 [Haplosporangium sp. Z 27]
MPKETIKNYFMHTTLFAKKQSIAPSAVTETEEMEKLRQTILQLAVATPLSIDEYLSSDEEQSTRILCFPLNLASGDTVDDLKDVIFEKIKTNPRELAKDLSLPGLHLFHAKKTN